MEGAERRAMNDTTVSVIIRTYNKAHLLREALISVMKQTICPKEVIIVDDASTDETPDVITSFVKQESRIRHVRLPVNHGMYLTGKVGMENSNGSYIAFLDHDDVWLPEHLERCCDALRNNPQSVLAFSDYGTMDIHGRVIVPQVFEPPLTIPPLNSFLLKKIIVQPSRSIYSRKAILELGGIPPLIWDWILPVLLAFHFPDGIIRIRQRTVLSRVSEAQSYSQPEKILQDLLDAADYIFRYLPPTFRYLQDRVMAINLLHSAYIF